MKVAVLFTGQIRNAKENFELMTEHVIKPYNPDVYIETWRLDNVINSHFNGVIPNDASIDDLIQMYSPRKILVEDLNSDECNKIKNESTKEFNRFPETKVENVFFQYYKIMKGFSLIEDPSSYDFIIRTRFDLRFHNFPNLEALSNDKLYIPYGWDHGGGINDLMAFGNPENMKYYCDLYNNFNQYIQEGCYVHPEFILKYHLDKKNILIERPVVDCFIGNSTVNFQRIY